MPNISANISASDLHEVVDDDAVAAARVALLDGHTPLVADAHLAMAPWLRCVTMPRRWHGFVVYHATQVACLLAHLGHTSIQVNKLR